MLYEPILHRIEMGKHDLYAVMVIKNNAHEIEKKQRCGDTAG